MAGEGQLLLHRKDAHADAPLAFDGWIARQDERGLREIHFLGERLHLGVGQSAAVEEYGQRIAFERTRRENVPLHHRQTSWGRLMSCFPDGEFSARAVKT